MPMIHISQVVPGEIEVHQVFALNQQMLHHLIIKYADTRNVFGFPFRIKSGSLYWPFSHVRPVVQTQRDFSWLLAAVSDRSSQGPAKRKYVNMGLEQGWLAEIRKMEVYMLNTEQGERKWDWHKNMDGVGGVTKGRHQLKKNVFFRALPESPKPPPMTPIRATWSFFFGRQKRRFSAYYRTK